MKNIENKCQLRKMEIKDLDAIWDIEKLSFSIPWSRHSFNCEIVNDFAYYVVCEVDKNVVGYAGMWLIIDEAHVTTVAVHPFLRGRGLGELLLAHLLEIGLQNKTNIFTLEVRPSNTRALNLYRKYGFKKIGRRKGYYSDNGEDAIVMWKKIS